jgi:cytochrome P450
MPYLQAVVKESLRIFPPVAMTPKMSTSEEIVCGVKIPAGTSVELSIKTALRDRAIFGQDADMFRPERWIESENTSRIQPMEDVLKFV